MSTQLSQARGSLIGLRPHELTRTCQGRCMAHITGESTGPRLAAAARRATSCRCVRHPGAARRAMPA